MIESPGLKIWKVAGKVYISVRVATKWVRATFARIREIFVGRVDVISRV